MKYILVMSLAVLALFAGSVSAQDTKQKEKIEFLISAVENLKGSKFVRNGSEHNGKEAAKHLRMKLKKGGDRIKTADDFIRFCASKSSVSGKPYMIRFPDGKTITSEEYFREKLKGYNSTVK